MEKVISFCLWGSRDHYLEGAKAALEGARASYPGWSTWFYLAEDVPSGMDRKLEAAGAKVIRMDRTTWRGRTDRRERMEFAPAFWRFLPASDPGVEAFLVRDADSPVTPREVAAVDTWLASGKDFHIMRDHPKHEMPILAGMWGCRTGRFRDLADQVRAWHRFDYYGSDQTFLERVVYPKAMPLSLIHSECVQFPGEQPVPFPTARVDREFVGISLTGDERLALQLGYLEAWLAEGRPRLLRPLPHSLAGRLRLATRGRWPRDQHLPAHPLAASP